MSKRLEKIKQESASADTLIQELLKKGELTNSPAVETLNETQTESLSQEPISEQESTQIADTMPNSSANDTIVESAKEDGLVSESQYKSAVKAMNAAQKERAETEKLLKDIAEQNKLIQQELQLMKSNKGKDDDFSGLTNSFSDDDSDEMNDLENELPKTVKIAEKKALEVKTELSKQFKTVEDDLRELKKELEDAKVQKELAQRDMVIKQSHPDFDEVRFSDEFKSWIYNSAPSMYKGVYEGTIPFGVDDVIKVFDDYKISTGKPKHNSQSPIKKPGSAESKVKTNPTVTSNMAMAVEETLTEQDFLALPKMIHRLKDPAQRKALMDKADAFLLKQQKTIKG